MGRLIEESRTTTPMSNEEIVENLKTMTFGKQAYERFNAKERETLDRAWNIIDQYETRLKADMVAMLTEIQLEIEEMENPYTTRVSGCAQSGFERGARESQNLIQQKINSLKEAKDGENNY